MNTRHLKIASILSALLWAVLLIHIYWLFAEPLPDGEPVRQFAEKYRITSSIEISVFVAIGVGFSLLVWLRQAPWLAIVLIGLALFVLWRWYLSGLLGLFQPPLGDGTFAHAVAIWWRLHEPLLGWHLAKILFLVGSAVFCSFAYVQLSKRSAGHFPTN